MKSSKTLLLSIEASHDKKSKEVRLAMSGSNYLPTVVSNTNENQTESP